MENKLVFKFCVSEGRKEKLVSPPHLLGSVLLLSAYVKARSTTRGQSGSQLALPYLHNVCRLVYELFKDQDGRNMDVDVVLPCHLFHPSQTDIHISKGEPVFVCKSSQLLGRNREEEMTSTAQHVNYKSSVTSYIRGTLAYCIAPLGLLHPCALVGILWCSCMKTAPTKLNTTLFFPREKSHHLTEMHSG